MKNYTSKKTCRGIYTITLNSKSHGVQRIQLEKDWEQTNMDFNGCWRAYPLCADGEALYSSELNDGEFYDRKRDLLNELKFDSSLERIAEEVAGLIALEQRRTREMKQLLIAGMPKANAVQN